MTWLCSGMPSFFLKLAHSLEVIWNEHEFSRGTLEKCIISYTTAHSPDGMAWRYWKEDLWWNSANCLYVLQMTPLVGTCWPSVRAIHSSPAIIVETDLDITNGAWGKLVDITFHPNETPIGNSFVVHLRYMPLYILVKLTRTRATPLEGLEDNVIPIEPAITIYYHIRIQQDKGYIMKKTVQHRKFPMAAAYGFTDYLSQGRTLVYVITVRPSRWTSSVSRKKWRLVILPSQWTS